MEYLAVSMGVPWGDVGKVDGHSRGGSLLLGSDGESEFECWSFTWAFYCIPTFYPWNVLIRSSCNL
jgi:hypothetical protein